MFLAFRVEGRSAFVSASFIGRPGMAFEFDNRCDAATEQNMRDFFGTLPEKDQRRFSALEAKQKTE